MLYRALECCVMGRPDEPTATAWITGHSREDARQRLQAALAATWGVEPTEIVWGHLASEVELERNSCQLVTAGARRWLECGQFGLPSSCAYMPDYDNFDHVLIFLPARDRRRLANAWFEARQHAGECSGIVAAEAKEARERGDQETGSTLQRYADRLRLQACSITDPVASAGNEIVGAVHLHTWLGDQRRDLGKAADQFERARRLRENGSPSARDYETNGREILADVLCRHPNHTN
jgi:hypothetical protein|uniref:Uncharacterized protein n=1 Tax=Caenorhabditis japonica TaxID=281687 RepID=A0A8R1IKJ5_CAEJA